jgi:hypothetical protein
MRYNSRDEPQGRSEPVFYRKESAPRTRATFKNLFGNSKYERVKQLVITLLTTMIVYHGYARGIQW